MICQLSGIQAIVCENINLLSFQIQLSTAIKPINLKFDLTKDPQFC